VSLNKGLSLRPPPTTRPFGAKAVGSKFLLIWIVTGLFTTNKDLPLSVVPVLRGLGVMNLQIDRRFIADIGWNRPPKMGGVKFTAANRVQRRIHMHRHVSDR
jgi:hypothetical protein